MKLSELRLLGYTIKKHLRGYIVATSPQGTKHLYTKNGEMLIHNFDLLEIITNDFIIVTKDTYTIAFTTYNNKQIKDFKYPSSYRVSSRRNTLFVENYGDNGCPVIYNSKGKHIEGYMGDKMKPKKSYKYYYNEEKDSLYWMEYDELVLYTLGNIYRNNELVAEDVNRYDFNAYYYLRRFVTEYGTKKYKIYSTKTNKLISEKQFSHIQMSKCAVVRNNKSKPYLVKGETMTKIDIPGLEDIYLIQDNNDTDLLVVKQEGKYSILDTNLNKVSEEYNCINPKQTHTLMVAERLDGTLTVIGTDGREYLKSREYHTSTYDFKIMNYDILVTSANSEMFIPLDNIE